MQATTSTTQHDIKSMSALPTQSKNLMNTKLLFCFDYFPTLSREHFMVWPSCSVINQAKVSFTERESVYVGWACVRVCVVCVRVCVVCMSICVCVCARACVYHYMSVHMCVHHSIMLVCIVYRIHKTDTVSVSVSAPVKDWGWDSSLCTSQSMPACVRTYYRPVQPPTQTEHSGGCKHSEPAWNEVNR